MKYLKKIFESSTTKEQILQNFVFINDEFGPADIKFDKFGDDFKWWIKWPLDINFKYNNPLDDVSKKIEILAELMQDIKSASSRLDNYEFTISIGAYLCIQLTPKVIEATTFDFIQDVHSRTLFLNITEIEKFFRIRNINILNTEETFDEPNERGDVEITLTANDGSATSEFKRLFNIELKEKNTTSREFQCSVATDFITIYTMEDKGYVSLSS
jgi:hypothetical protein